MQSLITSRRDQIVALCRKYRVARLDVFGSAVTDDFDEQSDVDFLVEFQDPAALSYADDYFGLKFGLEAMLDREVDLVVARGLINPFFRSRVESTKEPVYAA